MCDAPNLFGRLSHESRGDHLRYLALLVGSLALTILWIAFGIAQLLDWL
ncbi:MAG: hypothetical protein JWN59_1757 [Sphingomonas bacterium]|nr:hypothetical protein [Sphingomonas bacterium]